MSSSFANPQIGFHEDKLLRFWTKACCWFLSCLILFLGAFFLARRLQSGFVFSSGVLDSLGIGLVLSLLGMGSRWSVFHNTMSETTTRKQSADDVVDIQNAQVTHSHSSFVQTLVVLIHELSNWHLAIACLGFAVVITPSQPLPAFALWMPIVVLGLLGIAQKRLGTISRPWNSDALVDMEEENQKQRLHQIADSTLEEESPLDRSIDQLLIRSQEDDGSVIIYGRIRGRFGKNERTKNLHIAFCPPLQMPPVVSVELAEGPDAQVSIGQTFICGIRIDVKLASLPMAPVDVVVEVFAKCE